MSTREEVDSLLLIFDNVFLSEQEYNGFSELYDFKSTDLQSIFNTTLYIIKHRLKRNTQTPYNIEAIRLYAKNKGLTIPFDLSSMNKSSTEVLFGVVRNG